MNQESFERVPGIAGDYISVATDEQGRLASVAFSNYDNFNFAYDVVDRLGTEQPEKLAMLHVDNEGRERRITFRDMMLYSNRCANYFRYLGIRRGDRVMLVLKRNYQYWFTILALHKLGAVAIPATSILVHKDYEYRFKFGKIDAVVCTGDGTVAQEVERAAKGYDGLKAKILVGPNPMKGWNHYQRDIRYFSKEFKKPEHSAGGEDTMLMFFTSGTSAYPKLASHSYLYPLGHYVTARYWHQVDPEGIHFTISDTGWAKAAWGKIYGQWLCEAAIFTYDFDEFYASKVLKMLEKYKITTFCAPPTAFRVFVHTQLENYDLSSLKHVSTAGEALNPEVYQKFLDRTGLKIMEGFGQTETTLVIANLAGTEPRPGSMGKANPQFDVRIVNPDGVECPVGEAGEICIRLKENRPMGLFQGYYQDQDKTDAVMDDTYYHMGDKGYVDADGYFWYVGRVDDVIKSTGYRVGPIEIENEIMKLPYVLECAVTAIPDAMRGQAIKASVVLTSDVEPTDALKKEMVRFFKANLASYKRPKVIDFVKELPKTSSGKIKRAEIKNRDWKKNNK